MVLVDMLILVPLAGAIVAAFAGRHARWVALATSFALAGVTVALGAEGGFSTVTTGWTPAASQWPIWMMTLDGISAPLVLLTSFLAVVAILASWNVEDKPGPHYAMILALVGAVMGVFLAEDIFVFYVFWEAVLIPMFFLIGLWGHANRKHAAMKFFLYTFAGSVLMFVGILVAVFATGMTNINDLILASGEMPADLVFWLLVIGMLVKIPVVPLHTWLPDAHVEAPTAGSILLAGVLLKMGGYALIRIAVPMAPTAFAQGRVLFAILGIVGIVYGAAMALGAEGPQASGRILLGRTHGIRPSRHRRRDPHRPSGRHARHGESRCCCRAPVPPCRHLVREDPHARDLSLRRARQAHACLGHRDDVRCPGQSRLAWSFRLPRGVRHGAGRIRPVRMVDPCPSASVWFSAERTTSAQCAWSTTDPRRPSGSGSRTSGPASGSRCALLIAAIVALGLWPSARDRHMRRWSGRRRCDAAGGAVSQWSSAHSLSGRRSSALWSLSCSCSSLTCSRAKPRWPSGSAGLVVCGAAAVYAVYEVTEIVSIGGVMVGGRGYSATAALVCLLSALALLGGWHWYAESPPRGRSRSPCRLGRWLHQQRSPPRRIWSSFLSCSRFSLCAATHLSPRQGTPRSREAGVKYVIQGSVATGLLVLALAIFLGLHGSITDVILIAESLTREYAAQTMLVGRTACCRVRLQARGLPVPLVGTRRVRDRTPCLWCGPGIGPQARRDRSPLFIIFFRGFGLTFTDVELPTGYMTISSGLGGDSHRVHPLRQLGGSRQSSYTRMLGYSGIAQVGYALVGLAIVVGEAGREAGGSNLGLVFPSTAVLISAYGIAVRGRFPDR